MSIAELQKQISLKAYRRYEAIHGPIAELDAKLEARLASKTGPSSPTMEELRRRYPGAFEPQVPTTGEPGPVLRQAREFRDALRKLRQGSVGEARGTGEASAHKLDRLIIVG